MDNEDIKQVMSEWGSWKNFLGQAVEFADELGIGRERIFSLAQQAGDILADNVDPSNPEQKTVKELWSVADKGEKQVLASLMVRLVSKK
ncbi:MAG TPA: DUF3243 domain-containing protein [Desulfotomaculum sp.]|nr:MAG: hypothetical protein XD84_1214 [Desulfotomaculum sp. 46_80]KUK85087.1 MAG: hypothetical protein XE00_0272 [Desulfofundulus kuznetsovii]HAG09933.1 DUF3243 domain-containing protein [Desulfotomaculum sp.]HBY04641.1 DUF3243 domain-containing protein [Desulfotomaculum sp.]